MKTIARLCIVAGSLVAAGSLFLFSGILNCTTTGIMACLTVGLAILLVGVHLQVNLLNKEYFYYYIFPLFVFLVGIDIHNYYTGDTSFNGIAMGVIPNTAMIAGCIVGFILNKRFAKAPAPSADRRDQP